MEKLKDVEVIWPSLHPWKKNLIIVRVFWMLISKYIYAVLISASAGYFIHTQVHHLGCGPDHSVAVIAGLFSLAFSLLRIKYRKYHAIRSALITAFVSMIFILMYKLSWHANHNMPMTIVIAVSTGNIASYLLMLMMRKYGGQLERVL